MKKILILFFILIPFILNAGYDSHTIAVYDLNNDTLDSSGHGYNLTAIGTGCLFQSDTVKSGYGYTFSMSATTGNTMRLPDTLQSYFTGKNWTIEGWWYTPKSGGTNYFLGAFDGLAGHYNTFYESGGGSTTMDCYYNSIDGITQAGVFNSADWYFWSIQFDGLKCSVYINGTLKGSIGSTTNMLSISGLYFRLLQEYDGTVNTGARMNKVIISDTLRNGIETIPSANPTIGEIYNYNLIYSPIDQYK